MSLSKDEQIWNPDDNTICTVPSLPSAAYHGTLNGVNYCYPYGSNGTECLGFNQGVWSTTNAGFQHVRGGFHTSWETEGGIYIMGGETRTLTSELARNDGTVTEGFSLRYPIRLMNKSLKTHILYKPVRTTNNIIVYVF